MEILGLQSGYRNWHKGTGSGPDSMIATDAPQPPSGFEPMAVDLAVQLLSAIERYVLSGEAFNDLAARASKAKYRLAGTLSVDVLAQAGAEIDAILQAFQTHVQDTNSETAMDFKRVLSLVNESFSRIQAGDAKSDERLKYFEKSLHQASKMDSLLGLRRHLAEMMEFVRSEGKADQAEKELKLQSMKEQMQHAQAATARLRVQVPGRTEALDHMGALIAAKSSALDYTATLFVVDSLKALRARHGEDVASSLLDELARRQIQPLSPEGRIFWWSNASLALVSKPLRPGSSAGVLAELPNSFEHRAFIGARVATFKVSVRTICTAVSRGLKEVTSSLDNFAKERLP